MYFYELLLVIIVLLTLEDEIMFETGSAINYIFERIFLS